MFGSPAKITTVDKYQGQQNDYILLSLVRTDNVGHLRDTRRLIVAMSRARLGLYVFGRAHLFVNCFELAPILSQLMVTNGTKLELVTSESYSTSMTRKSNHEELSEGTGEVWVMQEHRSPTMNLDCQLLMLNMGAL